MTAYYNEYDAFAAATLRELMEDGLIAPGVIDERSIELVEPQDLKGFTQVHLFAGIGVWSLAARLAGWADDRPLWSASCPCPPFSSAGKIKACPGCGGLKPIPHVRRTGFFLCSLCGTEWLADQRHLWPEVWRLVRDERPPCIVGEQVASADGRTWLDLIRASLEVVAYDAWGVDTCAAGFGAPHIRQRLYWVADTANFGVGGERGIIRGEEGGRIREISGEGDRGPIARHGGGDDGMADAKRIGRQNADLDERGGRAPDRTGGSPDIARMREPPVGLVDSERARSQGLAGDGDDGDQSGRFGKDAARSVAAPSEPRGLADASGTRRRKIAGSPPCDEAQDGRARRLVRESLGNHQLASDGPDGRPGPTNGLWRSVDWLRCTDARWRPVESGTFPLANAGAFRNRVAELRGAGNAVNLAQATGFIRAIMNELPGGGS